MDGFIKEFGGSKNGFFYRNIFLLQKNGFEQSLQRIRKRFGNVDVYYSVYSYEDQDIENCRLYGAPYLDLDLNLERFEEVKWQARLVMQFYALHFGIPFEMQEIYFSGSKGFHVLIPPQVFGITPDRQLNVKHKKLAAYIRSELNCDTIDLGIYDRKRLFRLPNSINSKTGFYKVPVSLQFLYDATLADICRWASKPRAMPFARPAMIEKAAKLYQQLFEEESEACIKKPNRPFEIPTWKKPLLPCVEQLLVTGVAEGRRNNTSVALASSLMQSGYTLEETEEIMVTWNTHSNEPPLGEREILATIRSAYNMLQNSKTYGCSAFHDLDLCVADCKLNEAQSAKENDVGEQELQAGHAAEI